jgi:hypothetical protein
VILVGVIFKRLPLEEEEDEFEAIPVRVVVEEESAEC